MWKHHVYLQRKCSQNSLATQPLICLKSTKRILSYRCKEDLFTEKELLVFYEAIPLLPTFKPRKEISMRQLGELNLCPLICVWLMPEKSKKKNAGVSSWQKRMRSCSVGSNFTPSTKRFISCGSDLRVTCQGGLVSSCLRSCLHMGTSAKQAGDVLSNLRGSERHLEWPARRMHPLVSRELQVRYFQQKGGMGISKEPIEMLYE